MINGWNRNPDGLKREDFIYFTDQNGVKLYLPEDSDGLFDSTVHHAAKKYELLVPSLGDIVDFINVDKSNANFINEYLKSNVLITSTGFRRDYNERVSVGELNNYSKTKKSPEIRVDFKLFGSRISMLDVNSLVCGEKNIVEVLFQRDYVDVVRGLNSLETSLPKNLMISSKHSDDLGSMSIVKYEQELLICRHQICNGEFCLF
ncbi:MAG: hypothetical protein ACP5N2_05125 [Candidatus Nanoarchaeia archaeon]